MPNVVQFKHRNYVSLVGTEDSIPLLDEYLDTELYYYLYNYVVKYYNINTRYFSLFRGGSRPLNDLGPVYLKEKYGFTETPLLLLQTYRTYFKSLREVNALALAFANATRSAIYDDEMRTVYYSFLDSIAHQNLFIASLCKYLIGTSADKYEAADFLFRCKHDYFVEVLLLLDTPKNAKELAMLLELLSPQIINFMEAKHDDVYLYENSCLFMFLFHKVVLSKEFKKEKPFVTRMNTIVQKLSTKHLTDKLISSIKNVLDWSETMLRYYNAMCRYVLGSKYYTNQNIYETAGIFADYLNIAIQNDYLDSELIQCVMCMQGTLENANNYSQAREKACHEYAEALDTSTPLRDAIKLYGFFSERTPELVPVLLEYGFFINNVDDYKSVVDEKYHQNCVRYLLSTETHKCATLTVEQCRELILTSNSTDEIVKCLLYEDYFSITDKLELLQKCKEPRYTLIALLSQDSYDNVNTLIKMLLEQDALSLQRKYFLFNNVGYSISGPNSLAADVIERSIRLDLDLLSDANKELVYEKAFYHCVEVDSNCYNVYAYSLFITLGKMQEDYQRLIDHFSSISDDTKALGKLIEVIAPQEVYKSWKENQVEESESLDEIISAYQQEMISLEEALPKLEAFSIDELQESVAVIEMIEDAIFDELTVSEKLRKVGG